MSSLRAKSAPRRATASQGTPPWQALHPVTFPFAPCIPLLPRACAVASEHVRATEEEIRVPPPRRYHRIEARDMGTTSTPHHKPVVHFHVAHFFVKPPQLSFVNNAFVMHRNVVVPGMRRKLKLKPGLS